MKKLFLYLFLLSLSQSPLLAESGTCNNTRNGYPSYPCQGPLKVGAEWLYWKAEQSQMEIAANVIANDTNTFVETSFIAPNFKYSSGYRVYADYVLNDCWTVGASLVHLPSQPFISVSHDPALVETNFIDFNSSVYPIFNPFAQLPVSLSNLEIQWNLNLYYLDSYVRRRLCLCRCITIDPYLGARVFWMKQRMNMSGNSPNAAIGSVSVTASFSEKFCGAGLLSGINAFWQLKYGFSFIAQFGGSLIYSAINNDFNVQAELAGSPLQILNRNEYHKSHPTIDSFIGMQYLHMFSQFSAEAHIGWENHLFFHTNQFSLTTNGNLTLQGLTLGGSFIF